MLDRKKTRGWNLVGSVEETVFFTLLMCSLPYMAIRWSGTWDRYQRGEPIDWTELACAFISVLFGITGSTVPVGVVLLHVLTSHKFTVVPKPIAEFCGVYVMWNSHLIAYASFIIPYLFTPGLTFKEVFYDYMVFVTFVPSPLVLSSAALKIVCRSHGWAWGWTQRILLGVSNAIIALCMWYMKYHLHGIDFWVTLVQSVAFYFYAAFTFHDWPETNGRRMWPRARGWNRVWDLAIDYLDLKVIVDKRDPNSPKYEPFLKPDRPYIMGFHPHGIIPYSAGLISLTREWDKFFPGVISHFMIDFMLHLLPVTKDIIQWLGCREVSKEAVKQALDRKECILIIPGGQVEMFESRSWDSKVIVYKGHVGFVRMALEHNAELVPVISIGEWDLMDNIYMPSLQNFTRKRLGFPVPFVPQGRFLLPMARKPKHGVTIVIGEPVAFKPKCSPPSEEDVKEAHQLFYQQLQSMFDRHKAESGYPSHQLVIVDKLGYTSKKTE